MHLLYNIGILFLGLGIRIHSLFNPKTKLWVQGRKNWRKNLPTIENREVIWFHCASLGEFDQGLPLMRRFKKANPDLYILVTFFSPSGMQHYHKRNHPANHVCYLPLDTPRNARHFIKHFKPKYACFIKYEFWSNYILASKKQGGKIYNISGIFRENHRFFKSYGSFFRYTLEQFDWFFVQNQKSIDLLHSIKIEKVSIVGDSRYDKVYQTKKNHVPDARIAEFCGKNSVFIVGSSWPKDEEILLPIVNAIACKVIVAPHNIDARHINGITSQLKRPFVRYTDGKNPVNAEVLILDTIGQLSSAYSFGSVAYVGGGFSGSLHNILEPAVFGMGVIFGPKHDRFPEAEAFINNGFGFDVSTSSELRLRMDSILENKECISEKATKFVNENRGATRKMYALITAN